MYIENINSPKDLIEIGHTSTSIALATGLQKGRDILGGKENVIAVIGDGSLSGGEAFEGLDTAAELGTNIIIIVNDNEMSIAENHGGLYRNLKRLRESGGQAECNYFRTLGFDYLYVERGNNVGSLVEAFRKVKDIDHPVVVHIHTEKGHGYAPAVADKERWHWSMPFHLEDGSPLNRSSTASNSRVSGQAGPHSVWRSPPRRKDVAAQGLRREAHPPRRDLPGECRRGCGGHHQGRGPHRITGQCRSHRVRSRLERDRRERPRPAVA